MELGAARSFFSKDPALPCTGAGLICALPDKERGLAQPVLSLLDKELKVPRSPPRGAARVVGDAMLQLCMLSVSLPVILLE
jgi:hypothetical protein